MSYLKNARIGRRRKPRKTGSRGAPARNLRAPSGGPIFHNLPGTTSQKIIAMGFDLGNGFPDMENYFRFLTSLSDAGLGYNWPVLANNLNPGRMDYWSSAHPSGPPVNPQPGEIAIATDALWDYTDPDNWRLGKNDADPNGWWSMPYRMQDVWAWYAMGGGAYGSGSYCNSNPCLSLRYLGGGGGGVKEMPWSYVGTVQPGGRTRLRTRKGMVKFLRDYAKYIIAKGRPSLQQPTPTGGYSLGGKTPCPVYYCPDGHVCKCGAGPLGECKCVKASTSYSGPRPSQTSNINPLQRKLQANTFRPKRNRR
jgi:hypothetical protein